MSPIRQEYMMALDKELAVMHERKVLQMVSRKQVKPGAEIGHLILLFTRKRDGRFKARMVFNKRR